MEMPRIYLDYNAATPMDAAVATEFHRACATTWANASSTHREGQAAKALLASARARIARPFHVQPQQIVFFATATEALTTLIHGLLVPIPESSDRSEAPSRPAHIITSVAEHVAVWKCCRQLESQGCTVTFLPVGAYGAVCLEDVRKAITPQTTGIAIMSVNNETGVMTDIDGIAAVAHEHNIPLLVDGVAHLGKAPFTMADGISAACFSSYKFHGPCGVGFAVLHRGVAFRPLIEGGGQESGRRGGSENVAAIHACSLALEGAIAQTSTIAARINDLRDLFERLVMERCPGVHVNGEGPRICNTSNLAFDEVDGEDLLIQLDLAGVSASHGAACSAGSLEASRVILEMGYPLKRAATSLRFSLGTATTEDEIRRASDIIVHCVRQQRSHRP
jgi:cysteine desulfurase